MEIALPLLPLLLAVLALIVLALLLAIRFRRVVSTNVVHIIQRGRATTPYGTNLDAGNVYYAWPSWIPRFGVNVIQLPVSNFDLTLEDYEAYDTDRVPFMVHVTSFFRIADTAIAAQRIDSIAALKEPLKQWGVGPVKSMELMDIRDASGSKVISNIMAKNISHIEMKSRREDRRKAKGDRHRAGTSPAGNSDPRKGDPRASHGRHPRR